MKGKGFSAPTPAFPRACVVDCLSEPCRKKHYLVDLAGKQVPVPVIMSSVTL